MSDEEESKRLKELAEQVKNDIEITEEEKYLEKMSSAQEKYNLKGWLTSVLRRASYRWGPRSQSMRAARIERGLYRCNICKEAFKSKEVILDHIIPVVDIKKGFPYRSNGLPDWGEFIDRLFCDIDGFQVVCSVCHDAKTMIEDKMRAEFNAQKKAIEKQRKKAEKEKLKLDKKNKKG